jgi:Uma2 family endonuclease
MSKEQIYTPFAVKTEITAVTHRIARMDKLGMVLGDGLPLSNFAADISGNPDMTFLLNETLRSDRIRHIEGKDGGYTELQGSPDMVLEVLSKSSVQKDEVVLRQAYWDAGIREYWLVDAHKEPLRFEILHYAPRGYSARRKKDGWARSEVFGKSFRLVQSTNALGHPEYSLEVR